MAIMRVHASSVEQMVDLAIAHDKAYQQTETTLRSSEYQRDAAGAPDRPQVSIDGGHQYVDHSLYDDIYDSSQASIRVQQSLYNSGTTAATRQADVKIKIAHSQRRSSLHSALKDLALLYFDYIGAKEQLELTSSETDKLESLLAAEQQRFDAHTSSVIALSKIKADFYQSRARQASNQSQLDVVIDRLTSTFGILIDIPNPKQGDALELVMPEGNEQQWIDSAMRLNNTIRAAHLSIEMVEEQIQGARGGNDPSVSVFGSYGWNRDDKLSTETSDTQVIVGIQLSWLLYDGNASNSRVSSFHEDYNAAHTELEHRQQSVTELMRYYWRTLDAQLNIIESNTLSEHAALQSYQATNISFDAGTTTYNELLEQQNRYFNTERSLRESQYDFMRAYVELYFNAGLLDRSKFIEIVSSWIDA